MSVSACDISATALSAQRMRMNVIASNLANAHTTRGDDGMPYRRLEVLFDGREGGAEGKGVQASIVTSESPFHWVRDPDHPDAIRDSESPNFGQVLMPRVNQIQEMVDMMLASRAYEANLSAIEVSKSISSSVAKIIA